MSLKCANEGEEEEAAGEAEDVEVLGAPFMPQRMPHQGPLSCLDARTRGPFHASAHELGALFGGGGGGGRGRGC